MGPCSNPKQKIVEGTTLCRISSKIINDAWYVLFEEMLCSYEGFRNLVSNLRVMLINVDRPW